MSNDKDFKVKNGIQPTVYQESLGTIATGSVSVGYDLSVAAYDTKEFDFSNEVGASLRSYNQFIKPDGTKVYVCNYSGKKVLQYSLSTAWDISTATYDSKFGNTATQTTTGLISASFKSDGTKMYALDHSGYGRGLYQYTLSTAWDVSTISYDSVVFTDAAVTNTDKGNVFFKPDGTKFYIQSYASDTITEYNCSTPWDISTGSASGNSYNYSPPISTSYSFSISNDGKFLFIAALASTVYKYSLTTPWDISTATAVSNFSTLGQIAVNTCAGFMLKDDGTKMYVGRVDNSGYSDRVYQYSTGYALTTNTLDLSTGSVFEITPTSNIQVGLSNPAASGTVSQGTLLLDGVAEGYDLSVAAYDSVSFSVNSQDINPLDIAFNTDGTKMYIMGSTSDSVLQYSLSTGFDLSTASYDSVSFNVSSQDTNPRKLSFNNDGTKLYIFGTITDTVYQYSLSTAFDLSTTSYDSVSFNAASQATNPYGLAFNSDGTKMYLGSGTVFYQYSLSTAFDLSTTSYDSVSFNVSSQDSDTPDLTFNNDGTKMYVVGTSNDNVYQYSLSTAFDLSTASYDSVSFSIGSQNDAPTALAFSNDGTKMYIVGNINDTIYQYSTGSAYTVTYDSAIQFGGGTAPDSPLANETDVLAFSTRDGGTSYQAMQAIDGAK